MWGLAIGGGVLALGGVLVAVIVLSSPSTTPPIAQGPPPENKDLPKKPPPPEKKPEQKFEIPFDDDLDKVEEVQLRQPPPELQALDVPELQEMTDRPLLVTDAGGHSSPVKSCFFAFGNRHVVTVSLDKSVRLWDVATGDRLGIIRPAIGPADEGSLFAGAISPDNLLFACSGMPLGRGSNGMLIYLVGTANGRILRTYQGHKNTVVDLAFSPNGRTLASAGNDGLALLYDLLSGKVVQAFQGHRDSLRKLAFSHDGQMLATVSNDLTVRIWSVQGGNTLAELKGFPDNVLSVAWHPREKTLATGCRDGTLQVWDAQGNKLRNYKIVEGDPIQVASLQFNPAGNELLYGGVSFSGRAGIFNLDQGKLRLAFKEHNNTVLAVNYSRDGRLAVSTGSDDHETFVWRTADGAVVQRFHGAGKSVWGVGWRLDGKAIAWGNINKGNPVLANTPLERTFLWEDMTFGPPAGGQNFGRIISNLGGYSLKALDFYRVQVVLGGKVVHEFRSPFSDKDRLYSMTLLPGGRAVIGASFGMYLLDLKTNKVIRNYKGHTSIITGVSPSPDGRHFLSGGQDQVLSLWDPDKEEPLVSLFVADRDWIAWTPQGYYACSPYGENLMGWQMNHGPDKNASFHPAARFRKTLYNPELIQLLFREKNLDKAMALLKGKKEDKGVSVAQVLPPAVVITAPGPAERTLKQATVEVKAKAKSTGGHPISALRLLVDGRPYKGQAGLKKIDPPKLGEIEVAWTVDLLPGKHTVTVMAESPVSKGLSPAVEVFRGGGKNEELPTLYVVAAGISAYPGKLALEYAHKDAIVLEQTLRQRFQGVFRSVETKLLTNHQATKKNILEGLAWLEKVMTPRDVAIVFLAGHGTRDPFGQFFYIPVDLDLNNVEASCVSGETLKRHLANLPGRVVAILDACHSGTTAEKSKHGLADDFVRELVSEDYGVIVMCSSLGREYSMESSEVGHGFFTLGVIEALKGKGDFNKDGYIYLHEVDYYTYLRVRQLSGGEQNPTTGRPPHLRSFPLAKIE